MTSKTVLLAAAAAAALALPLALAGPASAKGVMLMNRIGPSKMQLFVANADGTGEHRGGKRGGHALIMP